MYLPSGYTQDFVLTVIDAVVDKVAPSFKFGYYDIDDIKQEARILAMDGLPDYKHDKGTTLSSFLYTRVKQRLINFKRDNYLRNDPPCIKCHRAYLHDRTDACMRYSAWCERNHTRQNIMNPLDIGNINDENEKNTRDNREIVDGLIYDELIEKIDRGLPVELRRYYLQMRDGISVPSAKREMIKREIRRILEWAQPEDSQ